MQDLIHLSFEQQIQLFKNRNMKFKNEEKAKDKLQHINYYKIKEFAEPFCNKVNNILDYKGVHFDYILKRYYNDKHLRINLFDAIEKIEVSIKTNLSHILGFDSMGAYGYLKFSNWCNRQEYCKHYLIEKEKDFKIKIKKYLSNTTNSEIKRKLQIFDTEYPPIWLVINILTFGDLVKILELISKNKLQKLAKIYGDITGTQLLSWLKTLNLVRNLCAHNSNIIDLKLKTTPKIHKDWENILFINDKGKYTNRLSSVLCIIIKLLEKIDKNYNFKSIKTSLVQITNKEDKYSEMLGFKNFDTLNSLLKNKVKYKY